MTALAPRLWHCGWVPLAAAAASGVWLRNAPGGGEVSAFPSPPAVLPTPCCPLQAPCPGSHPGHSVQRSCSTSVPAAPESRYSQDFAHKPPESRPSSRCLRISAALKEGKIKLLVEKNPSYLSRQAEGHVQCPFWVYFQDQAPPTFLLRPPKASLKHRQVAWTGSQTGLQPAQLSTINAAQWVGKAGDCLISLANLLHLQPAASRSSVWASIRSMCYDRSVLLWFLSYLLVALWSVIHTLTKQTATICRQSPGKTDSPFSTMFCIVSGCPAPQRTSNCFRQLVWMTADAVPVSIRQLHQRHTSWKPLISFKLSTFLFSTDIFFNVFKL